MASVYIQNASGQTGGTGVTTVSTSNFGANPTPGNFIFWCVFATHTGAVTVTPSDTLGNTYITIASGLKSTNICYAYGYAKNIIGGGTNAVTTAFSATCTFSDLIAIEYSGIDPFAPFWLGESAVNFQIDPATTADTVTSGTTPALARVNCLVVAVTDLLKTATTQPSAGTGFTDRGAVPNWLLDIGRFEDKRVTSQAATAGTFTSNLASENYLTVVAVFAETYPVSWELLSQFHPGRSPGKGAERFYQSPRSQTLPGVDVTVGLTGQAATFTAGLLTPSTTVPLLGQAAAFVAGTLTPSTTVPLLGQAATFAAGTLTPSTSISLVGQAATFTAGLLTPSTQVALTGKAATFTAGTVTPGISVSLVGQAATFAAGALTPASSAALGGQRATFAQGSLTPSGGDPPGGPKVTIVYFIANVGTLMHRK